MKSIVNVVAVVAVALGVWVAKHTLDSIDVRVYVTKEAVKAQVDQLKLSREQFTASRDAL